MKYSCTITINLPISNVVKLWENELHFKAWQDGFKSIERISGLPKTKESKSKITLHDKRKIELIETIISTNLPKMKVALYEHIHMTNTQTTKFKSIAPNITQYTSQVDYIKFNGLMIKLIAKIFPSKFKAQSQKWMNQFKTFAEKIDTI